MTLRERAASVWSKLTQFLPNQTRLVRTGGILRRLRAASIPAGKALRRSMERISEFRAGSIRTRLLGSISLLALIALLVAGVGVHAISALNQRLQGLVDVTNRRWMLSNEMQRELLALDRNLQLMVLETDPARITQGGDQIDSGQREILADLKRLQSLATPQDATQLNAFSEDFAEYQSLVEQIESDVQQNRRDAARQFAIHQGQALFHDANQALGQIGQAASQHMQEDRKRANEAYAQTRNLLFLISFLGIGLSVALAAILVAGVLRSLGQVAERMHDISAGEGDLTQRLPEAGQDEMSDLCRSFNHFLDQIEQIVGQVAASTRKLACASESISATMIQQAQGAELQQRQTGEVVYSIREMAEAATRVAGHAQEATQGAQHAARTAHSGGEVVTQAIQQMRAISSTVDEAAEKVRQLSRNSDQIGEIIDVIDEIADQTKLLALNAAIEAARAGDHGRGFAVVADAVRSLSDKTSKATHEIAARLKSIHADALATVKSMQSGRGRVTESVQTAEQANVALQGILLTADEVGTMVNEIAAAAEQQSAMAVQVNRSVDEIDRVTHETAAATRQVAESCRELSQLSLELERLVERFHLSGDRNQSGMWTKPGRTVVRRTEVLLTPTLQATR